MNKIIAKIRFLYSYFKSAILGFFEKKKFNKIQSFALFIGYPRSGHSLIAALLDAHPNIVMGMEWNILSHIKAGYKKNQIYYSLMKRSQQFSTKLNNQWTGYSYKVANQFQGRYTNIKIIGDKLGSFVSKYLIEEQRLFECLNDTLKIPICYIHVIRNPFDVISTMTLRYFENRAPSHVVETIDLLPFVNKFFQKANAINIFKQTPNILWIDIYHEELIIDPKGVLKKTVSLLQLEASEKYLSNCAQIIYEIPHKSREKVPWSKELIALVEKEIKKIDFLSHYKFNQ